MRHLGTGGWILLLGLAGAAPAAADGPMPAAFCEDLKAVVADAGAEFAAFRGPRIGEPSTNAQGYTSIDYTALRSLSGATRCVVADYIPPDGKTLKSYRCEWLPTAGSKSKIVGDVAVGARQCVGIGDPMDSLKFYENDIADAYIYGDDFEINVSAGTAPKVFLRIRP